jgi:hypothetical protein
MEQKKTCHSNPRKELSPRLCTNPQLGNFPLPKANGGSCQDGQGSQGNQGEAKKRTRQEPSNCGIAESGKNCLSAAPPVVVSLSMEMIETVGFLLH